MDVSTWSSLELATFQRVRRHPNKSGPKLPAGYYCSILSVINNTYRPALLNIWDFLLLLKRSERLVE